MTHVKNNRGIKICLLSLLIMTIVFCGLYHKFLFGGQLYAYSDVGADTIDQYLPVTEFEVNALKQGNDGTYNLGFGLGRYCSGLAIKYLNLENIPFLLFGQGQLHIAVLLSLYLKYAMICVVALLFFRKLLQNDLVAVVSALLWTFSGYAVLWGQHYQFLTAMLAFTVAVYGFQLFLDGSRYAFLSVFAIAYLAQTSYYHLYIACYFFLLYGVLYLYFRGYSLKHILKKAGTFVVVMLLAVCMAGFAIVPALANFFNSTRMNQVTASMGENAPLYNIYTIVSFITRVISNNLIGVGDHFVGPNNYYECAILSVSVLFIFSFVYFMQHKYWKRFLFTTAACFLLLCMPRVSKILIFTDHAQRWTYLLCFAQVIGIGFGLTDICQNWKTDGFRKKLLRTIIISDLLVALLFYVLNRYHLMTGGWYINPTAKKIVIGIIGLYHVAFIGMLLSKRPYRFLVAAVALELVIGNYATVNERGLVSVEQWNNAMYHDGTQSVVQWIEQHDRSLYRINKTYQSYGNNDSLIQNYNGMGVYHSTNAAALIHLAHSYGYADAGNWLRFDGTDLLANTMLGVKYVIAQQGTAMDEQYYEKIYQDGTFEVYQNRYWLGFGYLYQNQLSDAVQGDSSNIEKLQNLSEGYYMTPLREEPEPLADTLQTEESIAVDETKLKKNLEMMQSSCVTDMTQNRNAFTGTVTNNDGEEAMLCVPLIYDRNWVAKVDGNQVNVRNINGGLVGIGVPSGSHQIELVYHNVDFLYGMILSIVTVTGYSLAVFLKKRRKIIP